MKFIQGICNAWSLWVHGPLTMRSTWTLWHFPQMIALNGAAVDVRAIPTPTTKGGA